MIISPVNAREELLAKLRRLSGGSSGPNHKPEMKATSSNEHRTPSPPSGPVSEDRITALAGELKRLSGEFYRLPSLDDLPAAVLQLARESHYKRIAVGSDPVLKEAHLVDRLKDFQDIRQLLNEQDSIPGNDLIKALAQCQLGITGCEAVIAETATVLLDHRGFGGRSISLLPECHVVVARKTWCFSTLDEWMDFRQANPQPLPSCLTFITGPSRTADIEKVLVTGVHGPLRLVLFLVD
jgi:L-lactate dehydrogenase complex protein LldG